MDGGHGCLQPWPELGDGPLEGQLAKLSRGEGTPLIRQALACARMDAAARVEGRWLFDGLAVPPSHATLADSRDERAIDRAGVWGCGVVKVKGGPDWRDDLPAWENLASRGFRLRLDFNEMLDAEAVGDLAGAVSNELKAAIDFLEDPLPFEPEGWTQLSQACGWTFAVDRQVAAPGAERFPGVVKPAVDDVKALLRSAMVGGRRLIVTSSMDHPIGQLWAAWQAAQVEAAGLLAGCGLLTHALVEPDDFTDQLQARDARLVPPPGTGLGYDDLLEALPWERLT